MEAALRGGTRAANPFPPGGLRQGGEGYGRRFSIVEVESSRRELWSCFSRRRAAPHDGPRFRATTMLYTAPPGAARFPGLFGDFYDMHFFVSLVLTARGSSD